MEHLAEVFSLQEQLISFNSPYVDELATIKQLHELPTDKQKHFDHLTLQLLDRLQKAEEVKRDGQDPPEKQARLLREEGNRVYKASTNENRLLEASRLYTKAIFKAENAYEELCLAFANRGMALQEFGYYQEAYDDCCYALEYGYNKKLKHKIVVRQAYCAAKMERMQDLETHLTWLKGKELNENYKKQFMGLEQKLKDFQEQVNNKQKEQKEILDREEILTDSNSRGRFMVAKKDIAQHEIIFHEVAAGFVPIEDKLICHQCASNLMSAPTPCPDCYQRVIYCSRKCRQIHANIHKYECRAYKLNVLQMLGVSHLAMRLVVTYLPEEFTHFEHFSRTPDLTQLAKENDNRKSQVESQYRQSLDMISHLNQVSSNELKYYALSANLLQVYLEKYTDFFEQFPASKRKDLKQIVSAQILRHAGQLLVNGHVGHALSFNQELPLLEPNLWQAPYRLKLGYLHKLSQLKLTTAINLPYLSLCNHACDPSIRIKFDGSRITVYASRSIKAGEEIFNCYTKDYKNSLKEERSVHLKEVYKFQCRCSNCVRSDSDEAYFKFHQYKCESCGLQFVPTANLHWWLQSDLEEMISCPHCKVQQVFPWYQQFYRLLDVIYDKSARQLLYKSYHQLSHWLIDNHSLKLSMAGEIVEACFKAREDACSLDIDDYENLVKIIRQQLAHISAQKGSRSLEYVGKMTYLWDLMALGKCQISTKETETMKCLLKNVARETSEIILNYYNDFIEQQQD